MKKRNRIIAIIILGIIIISNTPPFQFFLQENYHYKNKDGSFQFTEQAGMGRDFQVAKRQFKNFVKTHPNNQNKTLYRTFLVKPWKFWEWYQLIFNNERFRLTFWAKYD